jgi:hypothetical protein
MLCTPPPHTHLVDLLIPAASALLGVFVGGLITYFIQRQDRKHERYKTQLDFYSQLIAIRMQICSKGETRVELSALSEKAWQEEVKENSRDVLDKEIWPAYENIIKDNNEQLKEVTIPLYAQMLDYWTKNMSLSEPSTQDFFPNLVRYVDIWQRHLRHPLPAKVILALGELEKKLLYPLYDENNKQASRLRKKLE